MLTTLVFSWLWAELIISSSTATDEKNQEGVPTRDKGVKAADSSKHKVVEDTTAAKSDALSATEATVSLKTVCYPRQLKHFTHLTHARISCSLLPSLTHLPLVLISHYHYHCWTQMACAHTHTLTQYLQEKSREGTLVSVLNYQSYVDVDGPSTSTYITDV